MPQPKFIEPGYPRSMRLGRAALGVMPATFVLLLTIASGLAIALSDAAQPRFVSRHTRLAGAAAGPLGSVQIHLTAPRFYIALALMTAGYAGVLALRQRLGPRRIVTAILVLHAAFLLAPPLLSTDVFSYVDYARLGSVHGLDPYTASPSHARADPVFRYVHWRRTSSAYGPLFTVGTYGLTPLGPAGALWSLKVLAAAASLGCVALVWWMAGRLGRSQLGAATAMGLNPMLLVWGVGGAHNDLLMLLLLVGGAALVVAGREVPGAAAVALAVGIKASAGLAIPFAVLGARRRGRAAAGVLAGAAAVAAVAYFGFDGHALGMVDVLRREAHFTSHDSVMKRVAQLLGLRHVRPPLRLAAQLALAAAIAWLLVRTWRRRDWITACGWGFVAILATSTWFLPWYSIWPLPFAAASGSRRLLAAACALQAWWVVSHGARVLG
jgi:hypothetical protein